MALREQENRHFKSPISSEFQAAVDIAAAMAAPTIKLAAETLPSVCPEYRRSQPPNAVDEMVLRVEAKTAHPTFRTLSCHH